MSQDVRFVVTDVDLSRISDDWKDLVSAGVAIVEAHDRNRWLLGDLGGKVVRRYKEDSLGNFAAEIHVMKSTMHGYTQCSSFYSEEDRVSFPTLTWSHYYVALRTGSHDIALTWLGKAADEEWTVSELKKALDPEGKGGGGGAAKLTEFGGAFQGCNPLKDSTDKVIGYEVVIRTAKPVSLLDQRQVYTFKVFGVDDSTGVEDAE